jgi:hypothetical protein
MQLILIPKPYLVDRQLTYTDFKVMMIIIMIN